MSNILLINKTNNNIGLKSRVARNGPELDMVHEFIDTTSKNFNNKKNKLAIFVEPMVDTAYPDIVLAEYNPKVLDNWDDLRSHIEITDIKIFENIRNMRGANISSIFKKTHFSYKTISQAIERLYDAKLIDRKNGKWVSKQLKEIYSIQRLVSVEAKIGQLNTLLRQADINKWFASESYALSPTKKPQKTTIERFKNYGIGLCTLNDGKIIEFNKAEKQKLPTSYMSWMFNEWVGRYEMQ